MARGWGWGSWGRTRGSARPAWPGTTRWPHPAVEQRVEDVVGRGLGPPLQDLREEQELERNTDIRPRPPAPGPSPRLNQSSLPGCFLGGTHAEEGGCPAGRSQQNLLPVLWPRLGFGRGPWQGFLNLPTMREWHPPPRSSRRRTPPSGASRRCHGMSEAPAEPALSCRDVGSLKHAV